MLLVGDYIPKQKAVRLNLPPGTILANLEGPILGDHLPAPSPKAGPNLYSRACETDGRSFIFALANNHMMDYGVEGLEATKAVLTKAGIPFCGAGVNLDEARQPLIVEEDGKKVGIISCCERQFGCAEIDRPGVAEKGLWLFEAVRQLKQRSDFVIVSCHAAFEHAPFPSPKLREFYHLLIDAGADVIHGHHAHVPQGWETYHDGVIFYGLGNFVVDPDAWRGENHLWSHIVNLDFSANKFKWDVASADVNADSDGKINVKLAEGAAKERHNRYAALCNEAFFSDDSLIPLWQEVSVGLFDRYYGIPLHSPRYRDTRPLTLRNRARYIFDGLLCLWIGIMGKKVMTKAEGQRGLAVLNYCQCESHVDVIVTALGVLSGTVTDLRDAHTNEVVQKLA